MTERPRDGDELLGLLRSRLPGLVRVEAGDHGRQARGAPPCCGRPRALSVGLDGDRLALWACHHCGTSGAWPDLCRLLGDDPAPRPRPPSRAQELAAGIRRATDYGRALRARGAAPPAAAAPPAPRRATPADWRDDLAAECAARLWDPADPAGAAALAYLRGRGFADETLRAWSVGALAWPVPGGALALAALPVPDPGGEVATVRFRSVPGPCPSCAGAGCGGRWCDGGRVKKAFLHCPGRPLPLFGAHLLPDDPAARITVTEGELDCVALWQYGVRGVVSGTAGAGAWKDAWLDQLEPYPHFVLAYDGDEKGDEGATKLAARLGRWRCSRARLPHKDAAECQERGVPADVVRAALDRAAPVIPVEIRRPSDYRTELEALVGDPARLRGLPTGSPKLDACLGGWPSGLVVVTGETGCGKTTFATWAALEQARLGVPVLVTSFEQRPIGTVQKLLRNELAGDFSRVTPAERAAALDALSALPLYLLHHAGHLDAADLVEVVRYVVRRLDVRLVVVDHLGFVVDDLDERDERRGIETVVRAIATVGAQDDVCVVVVHHPNRMAVAQGRRVTMKDLKGASAVEQDAHAVVVLERPGPTARQPHHGVTVHADKVRTEFGRAGSSAFLYYDLTACVYADAWADTPTGRLGHGPPVDPTAHAAPARRPRRKAAPDDAAAGAGSTSGGDRDTTAREEVSP